MKKRLLSIALATCMLLTLLPTTALAGVVPVPMTIEINGTYHPESNTISDGTEKIAGTLEDAITADSGDASTIQNLKITAGTVTADDWAYITNLTALEHFEIADGVTVEDLPDGANNSATFPNTILSVNIPQKIEIGQGAFANCIKLTEVSLPKVTSIGMYAFFQCIKLTEVSLPKLTEIGTYAFYYCPALTTANIPSLTGIGDAAFGSCTALATLKLGATPPTVGSDAFSGTPQTNLLVLLDANGDPLTDDALTNAQIAYKAVNDGNATDGLWYGWTVTTTPVSADPISFQIGGSYDSTNNTIGSGTTFSGDTLQAAIGSVSLTSVNNLKITAGAVTAADWAYIKSLTALEHFEIAEGVTVEAMPDATSASPTFRSTILSVNIPQITTIGAYAFYFSTNLTTVSLPAVTSIGTHAFYCTKLTTVSLPEAVSIGAFAFNTCTNLTEVDLPKATSIGAVVFNGCENLTTVSLPEVTTIGEYAFYFCENLTEVDLPAAMSIDEGGFNHCTNLTEVSLPKATTIGAKAFYDCTNLTEADLPKATTIGANAFYNCTKLTTLKLGATPPTVGAYAFYNAPKTNALVLLDASGALLTGSALTAAQAAYKAVNDGSTTDGLWSGWTITATPVSTDTISFQIGGTYNPDNNTIGSGTAYSGATLQAAASAVGGIYKIKNLKITAGEVTADDWAYIKSLTTLEHFEIAQGVTVAAMPDAITTNPTFPATILSVNIPQVTTIGACAFYLRTNLTTVSLPLVTAIGTYAFVGCTNLTTVSLPKAISIGAYAFLQCKNLTTVSLPLVTKIGAYAFSYCSSLTTVSLPEVTEIGLYAFSNCSKPTTVSLPKVTTIGASAFTQCVGLTTVSLPNVTTIDESAFWNCNNLTTVDLPEAAAIGEYVFNYCQKLETVSLPKVTQIGANAFANCEALTTLKLGATPPTAGTSAFGSAPKTNALMLLGASGVALTGSELTAAQALYKAVNDGDTTDGLWYGWTVTAAPSAGVSDAQAVAAAKAALSGGTVTVASGANQAAKTAAVQAYVNDLLTGDAAGVTATVTYNSGTGKYDVALSKGTVNDSKSLSMTVNESSDPNAAIVATAKTAAENANYADMTQAKAPNANAINAALKATADAAVGNTGVTVTVNQISYTAPIAGTAANTQGADGTYTFTVTVTKDGQSAKTEQKTITITATALPTYNVGGNVTDSTNTPLENASVKLMLGRTQVGAPATTDGSGAFTISGIPNGTYNLVVSKDGIVVTSIITVSNANYASGTIKLPAGKTNSVVEVKDNTPAIVVGKLDTQFGTTAADNDKGVTGADQSVVTSGGSVEIKLTAEEKTQSGASNGTAIMAVATTNGNTVGVYLDLSVVKTVTPNAGSPTETILTELPGLIEVRIPLAAALQGKSGYVVYRYHGSAVDTITTAANADGEKIELADGGATIILTVKKFSTYAVGYTPAAPGPTGGTGGSVASGTITAGKSDNGSITIGADKKSAVITPDDGYVIADVLVDGKSVGATEKYTFADSGSHKISAVFVSESALPYYLQNGERLYIGFSVITGKLYKYLAPAGVSVLFAENPKSFTDNTIAWAKPGIDFVTERELFLGTGPNSFSPNASMTRGMFVAVIGRLYERSYGSVSGTGTFSDVPQDAYYAKYVAWASENGIVRGIGEGKFAPGRKITREQMAAILLNFAVYLQKAEAGDEALRYPDSAEISAWAVDGSKFCQKTQIIMGRADGSFAPKDNATRAEVAAVIMRFIKTIVD